MFTRPEIGPHQLDTNSELDEGLALFARCQRAFIDGTPSKLILRSRKDKIFSCPEVIYIPNGTLRSSKGNSLGGRSVNNILSDRTEQGEYFSEYTLGVGSYYEKAFVPMLMMESVDNFISSRRQDFTDARYRSVAMSDVFSEAYRKFVANQLTNDDYKKSSFWVVSSTVGVPRRRSFAFFPEYPLGLTSWIGEDLEVCLSSNKGSSCYNPSENILFDGFEGALVAVDPQVGWEQQKFLVAWTLMYITENQRDFWMDRFNIWEIGADTDPGFTQRIEYHAVNGSIYVARTFGKEKIHGEYVQKGIGARVLEYANDLLKRAYLVDPGPDLDADGSPDWWLPQRDSSGRLVVRYDPFVASSTCDMDSTLCLCEDNRACLELRAYESMPRFIRQALADFQLADPTMRGLR